MVTGKVVSVEENSNEEREREITDIVLQQDGGQLYYFRIDADENATWKTVKNCLEGKLVKIELDDEDEYEVDVELQNFRIVV